MYLYLSAPFPSSVRLPYTYLPRVEHNKNARNKSACAGSTREDDYSLDSESLIPRYCTLRYVSISSLVSFFVPPTLSQIMDNPDEN